MRTFGHTGPLTLVLQENIEYPRGQTGEGRTVEASMVLDHSGNWWFWPSDDGTDMVKWNMLYVYVNP